MSETKVKVAGDTLTSVGTTIRPSSQEENYHIVTRWDKRVVGGVECSWKSWMSL